METQEKKTITVENLIDAPLEKVWEYWIKPEHIVHWNFASDDWHSPKADNDLRAGGKFSSRMEAKDGSFGFDFEGIYDKVEDKKNIEYSLGDARKVKITFTPENGKTHLVESFDAENTHSVEIQQGGWQAILNNFKKYVEQA